MILGNNPVDVMRGAVNGATGRVAPTGASGQPQVAPDVEVLQEQGTPSSAEKVFGTVESTGWNIVNLEFFPMIAAGVLGGVVSAGDWIRSKTGFGVSSAEKPGVVTKLANLLKLPSRFMGSTTIGDLASPSTLSENAKMAWGNRTLTNQAFEDLRDKHLATRAVPALEATANRLSFAGNVSSHVGNIVQQGVNAVDRIPGSPLSRLQKILEGRAQAKLVGAAQSLDNLHTVLATSGRVLPEAQVAAIRTAAADLKPLLTPQISALATGTLADRSAALARSLEPLKGHVAQMANAPAALTQTVNALEANAANVVKNINKSAGWLERATGWKSIGSGIASLPGKLKGMPLSTGLMGTAFLAMGAASAAKNLREYGEDKRGAHRLQQDLQGLPDSPLAAEMREAMAGAAGKSRNHALMQGAVNVATTGLSMRMLKGGGMMAMLPLFGAQMFGGTAAEILTPRDQFPHLYNELSNAHAKGQQLTTQHYSALLGMALPKHLKDVNMDGALMHAVTQQYAQAKFSPQQLLQDVATGGFDQRAALLKQQMEAQAAKPAAVEAPAPEAAAEAKPVIGKFTQAVNGQSQHHAHVKQAPVVMAAPAMDALSSAVPTMHVGGIAHEGRVGQTAAVAVGS